jgi:hypothetical protein
MSLFFSRPPVLIIGMHRSGTTMLCSMLEELGLYLGKKKNDNNEAIFFQEINDWILAQCGGAWDHPATVEALLRCREARSLTLDYLRYLIGSPRVSSYLGWRRYLLGVAGRGTNLPWGWKDPRTTVTLPLWLELFPEAKVLHIRRHGVDVARSLAVRHRKQLAVNGELYRARKAIYWLRPKRGGFTDTLRCRELAGGFSLWEEYLSAARELTHGLGERLLELKYEEFLAAPEEKLRLVADFCGLNAATAEVAAVAATARRERAGAYLHDPELERFAGSVRERLGLYGY